MRPDDRTIDLADWRALKQAQFERIAATQPGLQLVNYGTNQSVFMLVKSTPDFYEGLIIGQIPQRDRMTTEQIGRRTYHRKMRVDELLPERRSVDLVDTQVSEVLERWAKNQSAIGLEFVPCVFDASGKIKTR